MSTDISDSYPKSTPSLPPRPREISLIATFPNPWKGRDAAEISMIMAERWLAHSETFRTVAKVPNKILRSMSRKESLNDIIEIIDIGTLAGVAKAITTTNGRERAPGSLKRVNIFAHGNPGLIGLRGILVPKENAIYFGDGNPDRRPTTFMEEVDLSQSWAIDELAISWLNSCSRGRAMRDKMRQAFCHRSDCEAELWLIICHGSGGKGDMDVGISSNLSRALASTLQVRVRSYQNEVWYWPTPEKASARKIPTSDGKTGARGMGYYCSEEIKNPATGKRLGEHMKGATQHLPDPTKEPFKVECP